MIYDYEFFVWPDEERRFPKAMYDLFRYLNFRCTMTFTEKEFNDFREDVFKAGMTLREIGRTPHQEPETVL